MPLLDLPEEILFLILESAILPVDPRSSLPEPQSLLTCRTIHRIGSPSYIRVSYSDLTRKLTVFKVLSSASRIYWLPVFRAIGDAKGSLQTLDFVFHISLGGSQALLNGEDVWPTLAAVSVRRLVVRQGPGFFQGRALLAASALARAIEGWTSLPTVPLALALSRSPSLRVLRTPLPPLWNSSLLIVSENPSLVRIVFTAPQVSTGPTGVVGTEVAVSITALLALHGDHPWLVEAQKHPRLIELIGAKQGTTKCSIIEP
ncbi:hypothetical protein EI94DRAFT_1701890 [Lactarius quietus]|nr:hypothetical protein EI94DRAFT_1701890 [Lactarius quietus]